jgi:cytochrome c
MRLALIALPATLVLAACGQPAEEAPTSEAGASPAATEMVAAADPDAKPPACAQCATCHAVVAGAPHGVGPNLHGIAGRTAGTLAGFAYSPAMKSSGLVWDAATLDSYLEDPRAHVPGTKMAFAGIKDAARRKALVDWLMLQK